MMKNDCLPAELTEPTPCDDCPHANHCAATGDACVSFQAYVDVKQRWQDKPRQPRTDIGIKLGYREKEAA